jgi:hypothetical protein
MLTDNSGFGPLIFEPSLQRILERGLSEALQRADYDLLSPTFYRSQLDHRGLYYRSPIALQLAKGKLDQARTIAENILTYLASSASLLPAKVSLTSSGFLDYHFDPFFLGVWLEKLPQLLAHYPISYDSQDIPQEKLFYCQYIHNRCFSLLQLAQREQLLTLTHESLDPLPWIIGSPTPIPWLESQNLWLNHAAQRQLIEQILITVDTLETVPMSSLLFSKLLLNLAHSCGNFERYCRIFGEVQKNTPHLAQTRLGLLALVQMLFKKIPLIKGVRRD